MLKPAICVVALAALLPIPRPPTQISMPTFYKDVLPMLQEHCQTCHRPGEIGPMPLMTYEHARSNAGRIQQMVRARRMPPWFADPAYGRFANDPSLTAEQIETISQWVDNGTPAGDPGDAPPVRVRIAGWNIAQPDAVVRMPEPISIPARGDVPYTYVIVPTGFQQDTWVQMSEVRPSSREHVHHAIIYIRPPGSDWLRDAPINRPFTPSDVAIPVIDFLVYAPGSLPDRWPEGTAKFIPAGSDLVFQMHYTTNGQPSRDQTSVGLVFPEQLPRQRVLTLQASNTTFAIPPGAENYRVEVSGPLPKDLTLLRFVPHMHLRGKRFEYNILHDDGRVETLLRVNYEFHWQLSYELAEPRPIKAGTKFQAVAWFDNSSKNPHNPDPTQTVTWGDQTYEEMMVGFFDVAVSRDMSKEQYFIRQ